MTRLKLQLADFEVPGRPRADGFSRHVGTLSAVLTDELTGAADALHTTCEHILVAALGRAVARTIGDGFISVDVARRDDLCHSIALACADAATMPASDMLTSVHRPLSALLPLRMVRPSPTDPDPSPTSDVLFGYAVSAVMQ